MYINFVKISFFLIFEKDLSPVLTKIFIFFLPYLFYKTRTTGEVISRINDLGDVKESISKMIEDMLWRACPLIIIKCYFFAVRFAVKREEKYRQTLYLATIDLVGAFS